MAKRDVELVIRARDQAGKAIEGVADALRELNSQQQSIAESGQKADNVLGALAQEFRRLNSEVAGLSALSKVAGQVDKASNAVARLQTEFEQTSAQAAKLEADVQSAGAAMVRLGAVAREAGENLSSQQRALRDLTREQKTLDGQVDALKAGYARLISEFKKAKNPSEELRQSIRQQGIALINALDRQEKLSVAVKRQTAAVAENKAAYTAAQTAIRTAESSQRKIAVAAEQSSVALKEQGAALDVAKSELLQLKTTAEQAAGSLGNVAVSQRELAEASRQAAVDAKRVSDELRRQAAAPAQTASVQTGASAATAEYRNQTDALRRLRDEWTSATGRVKALANEIRQSAAPSQQLRTEFLLAQAAARQAKTAFEEQRLSLENLRRGIAATRAVAQAFGPLFSQVAAEQRESASSAKLAGNSFQILAQRLLGVSRSAIQANQALNQANLAARRAAAGVGTWGEATRRALSLGQRLRGEVLSLATAYVGLFQAVSQVGGLVSAFRIAEAASNRLGVVFQQDTAAVGRELQFLGVQADRLGLNFSVLSQEYSKFSIAASAAGLTVTDTRDAFLSIAEAARVNKSTTEELSGIYLAFTQILSKGKFTSEEVRRQLGDRLPGAFNLLADAIGVTGAELDRLLAAGELRADADGILKFTDELRRKFGPQLADSLSNTTAELDRLGNTIFQTQLTVGRGGFIDALTDAVRSLNASFQTQEAREFFIGLGAFLGNAVTAISAFVENFDKVIKVAQFGAAIVVGKFLTGVLAGLAQLNVLSSTTVVAINRATISFAALTTSVRAYVASGARTFTTGLGVAFLNLQAAVTGANGRLSITRALLSTLRVTATGAATAFTALWRAVGGFPGILITAATFLLTDLFFKLSGAVPDSTRTLEEHERQVQLVSSAYQKAITEGKEFTGIVENVSRIQADATLKDLEREYTKTFRNVASEARKLSNALVDDIPLGVIRDPKAAIALDNLARSFSRGTITAKEFQDGIDEVYQTLEDPVVKQAAQGFQALAQDLFTSERRLSQQAVVARALGSTYSNLDDIIRRFGGSTAFLSGETDDLTARLTDAAAAAEKYRVALDNLLEANNETRGDRERARRIAQAENDFRDALAALQANPEATQEQYDEIARARNELLSSIDRETDAYKEQQRIIQERLKLEQQRQEAIRKTAEDLQFQIEQTERSERDQAIASALRSAGLGFDASGRGADRIRSLSGQIFDTAEGEEQKKLLRELQGELDKILEKPISRDQFIFNEALRDNIDLATEFGEKYAELQGQIFDANEAIRKQREEQEKLRDLVDQVRNIEAERNNLIRDLQQALTDGNLPQANALREEVSQTNAQLADAVENARALAEALGDTRALTALAKVRTDVGAVREDLFKLGELQRQFAQGAGQAFGSVGDAIGGLLTRTESFGSALANVRDAFLSFAADFLRQIGQMIAQQTILNLLQNSGIGGGAVAGLNNAVNATASTAAATQTAAAITTAGAASATAITAAGTANTVGLTAAATTVSTVLTTAGLAVSTAITAAGAAAAAAIAAAGATSSLAGIFHQGGIAGSGGPSRRVPSAMFRNAMRYHGGGIAGIRPGEVPAILERGEEILTESDPRHMMNGGGMGGIKIINAIDPAEFISQGLSSAPGERAILNFFRSNASSVRGALGV